MHDGSETMSLESRRYLLLLIPLLLGAIGLGIQLTQDDG
jgi:hypothetical protein